jgi:hypothetical protein
MAKVPSPRKPTKGIPTPSMITLANLQKTESTELTPMNFRVPPEFHREYKVFAAQHGMSMVELLQESFRLMRDQRGGLKGTKK